MIVYVCACLCVFVRACAWVCMCHKLDICVNCEHLNWISFSGQAALAFGGCSRSENPLQDFPQRSVGKLKWQFPLRCPAPPPVLVLGEGNSCDNNLTCLLFYATFMRFYQLG